jgi:hypothetical protein
MSGAAKRKPFRLTAPVVPEHSIQKTICDVLRLELAPAGKVSRDGVVWFSIDHANFAGEIPGIRIGRGICAGILDTFLLYQGRAYFIEIKTDSPDAILSLAQQSVAAALLTAGGRVAVVRDILEVLDTLDAWSIPRSHRCRL